MATLSQFQQDRDFLLNGSPREGALEQRLYEPIRTGAQRGEQALTRATEFFQEEAGPERTFEQAGGPEALRGAVEEGRLQPARQLLGAQYAGPTGLGQREVAGLQQLTSQLRQRQRALGTGGGLQTLIGQAAAGLTPGEARFEAQRRLPGARQQAAQLGFETIAPLEARLTQERQAAQELAGRREEQEAEIARRAREELTGRRAGISGAVQEAVGRREAERVAAEEAFRGITEAAPEARMGAIQAYSPELAAQFATPGRAATEEAEAEFQEIMARPEFAGLEQYGPLEQIVTERGRPFYAIGGEDIRRVVRDPRERLRLYERQKALEQAFGGGQLGGRDISPFRPLYGEGFQPLDPKSYLGFDPGTRPSRETVSTEEQRTQFNRINNLLGELDRIGEAEPFRAAQIFAEADRYLEDEEQAIEAKTGELTKQDRDWRSMVKRARKNYRKAKRSKRYAQLGGVIGAVAGQALGIGPVQGATTGMQLGTATA